MPSEGRILIVDDSHLNREIMYKILEKYYTLETAKDGADCLKIMRRFEPDLILLDIMMPGVSGYEICDQIKTGPCGDFTQVILVSGKATAAERVKGYEHQADDYIIKPFNHDELIHKVQIQFRLRNALLRLWESNSRIHKCNENLEELIAQRTSEVLIAQDAAVFAMALLADSRDPETGEHLLRMRYYSQLLAKELSRSGPYVTQIDSRFLEDLYRATPLHDIGKVGVPDAILLKPGKLTCEEFETMKQHVVLGAETLELAAGHVGGADFLSIATEIARFHHERFNGSGYCSGKSGHDIPLSARIVAVADVYDALTSERVYKSAYSPEKAKSMIEEESGKHFDPAIVEAFTACFDVFLEAPKVVGEKTWENASEMPVF